MNKVVALEKHLRSYMKLIVVKIRNGKKFDVEQIMRCRLAHDTEVKCESNGEMHLGKITTASNVHLISCGGKLSIGKNVTFNRNVILVCRHLVSIADKCQFGPNVCIYDHDHAFGENGTKNELYRYGSIVIEENVWIGANCVLLRNTQIGKNSIIGAGCVVKGTIPPNSLVTAGRTLVVAPLVARPN